MSKYRITLEGKTYEMDIELVSGSAVSPAPAKPAPKAESRPAAPAAPAAAPKANAPAGAGTVAAPMPGTVIKIVKAVGDEVKEGELVLVLEAMKMENEILAPKSGTIKTMNCTSGGTVAGGDVLFEIG